MLLHDVVLLDVSHHLTLLSPVSRLGVIVAYDYTVLLLDGLAESLVQVLLGSLLVSRGKQISLGVDVDSAVVYLLNKHLLVLL